MLNFHKAPSPHFNERTLPLDSIILHYTDMPTADEALAWLCHPTSQVSAHYLIDEAGKTYQLVEDEKRAWHAGESFWQGCTNINSCSLGIELSNPGHSHGYQPFPEPQIEALLQLCEQLRTRWDIPKNRVLGHSDIAPRRKQDPGHLFPWEKLAREGLGLWPSERASVIASNDNPVEKSLATIGYETVSLPHTLRAFKRHFQPHQGDDRVDEETHLLIQGLLDSLKMPI
ncbi:N-acetylmuramoyl-L-alanine amidase [Geitlerinema splendidum]|jgi:N-acetylmuramoyl-L-alanine amidase|nr:N-acetylmuramoyl-L-alanine amidase [Geitlerinema splendidum]